MQLYLVRHGKALSTKEDPDKRLSTLGRAESEAMARFVKPLKIKVKSIWHSGKTRALQTAGYFALTVESKSGLKFKGDISPNDPVEGVAEQISEIGTNLMIVGHLPFLNRLASYLLTGEAEKEIFQFHTAGIICLFGEENGNWEVEWMLSPRIIPKL
ncbi:MAG: phosphohistidine phosphatase SixA [candidate division Zixibacteria bacterium]|nr:phosphohistidine phosphatase SixA [Candidatus Tariuqbacter arcticus]